MTEPEILEIGDEPVEPVESSPLSTFERFLLSATIWPTVLFMGWFICAFFWDADEWFDSVAGVAVFMVCISAGKRLRRFLVRGRLRAGIFIGAFGAWPGLTIGVGAAVVALTLAVGLSLDDDARREIGEILASAQIESEEAGVAEGAEFAQVSGQSGELPVWRHSSEHELFTSCVEELHQSQNARSMRNEAVDILKVSLGSELAEEAVQDVIIAVCIEASKGEMRELRSYFFRSIRNARSDLRKHMSRWDYCQMEEKYLPPSTPNFEARDTLRFVQKDMCRLDSRQAYIIRERVNGVRFSTIAKELNITGANARQIHKRSVDGLRERVNARNKRYPY
ncbi:hypothetical protein [Bradymonas sediminis]|uniref:Uncharacterized protein n=1 Tax=Bradymonas sediminis TaxID=1548548 RepID=A0A2Z4FIR6_9DELT|nr:hypothetical protein [Bradymonas sediminis]AWV88705.1 hypothetical protein DN745_04885 [Bradymonas sediminis]TDP63604.1 DNA-directed RNA polymerase specialized sigma24 family protein [Bradymonas sediminis]